MEELMPIILQFLQAVLILAVSVGVRSLISFINSNTNVKQKMIIEEIVKAAVLFAQQTGFDKAGKEKYEKAKERALLILESRGFSIDEDELDTIIEAMVKQAKKEFGENW